MPDLLDAPTPSSPESLDGIGQAFFATLDRDGSPAFLASAAVVAVALFVALVRWVWKERARDEAERAALEARHRAALAAVSSASARDEDGREWMRVPARLPLTLQRPDDRNGFVYETCETENLSGAGLAFRSHAPPPPGEPIQFTLSLDEKWPLALRGVVTRVEGPVAPGEPSLVAVRLDGITSREREHVVRWVTLEDGREVAEARRGPVCPVCHRPLDTTAGPTHPTCAAKRTPDRPSGRPSAPPAGRASSSPPPASRASRPSSAPRRSSPPRVPQVPLRRSLSPR